MAECKNCGNGYTGNCNCSDPIELVSTGPAGATGATGAPGTDGTSILFSNIAAYNATIGVTGETLFTYVLDNTPTQVLPTAGDFIKIKGRMSFYDTVNSRACDVVVNIGAYAIVLPRTQVYNTAYAYIDFDITIKKITNILGGVMWVADYGLGQTYITFARFSESIATSGALNFAADMNITVVATYVNTTTPPGVDIAFTNIKNAVIEDINITKYLQ